MTQCKGNIHFQQNTTDKLRGFMKFTLAFVFFTTFTSIFACSGVTLLGGERVLFEEIAFPLDYKNNDVAFWIAFVFLSTENVLAMATTVVSIAIWYLLLMCSLRYEVLGGELKSMGRTSDEGSGKMTDR